MPVRFELGVRESQVHRQDRLRRVRAARGGQAAVLPRRHPVQRRAIGRHCDAGGLQHRSEMYRAVPDGHRPRRQPRRRATEFVRRQHRRRQCRRAGGRPGRRERLSAPGVDHRQHGRVGPVGTGYGGQTLERRDPDELEPARARERVSGGDADPQAGERARSDADGDPLDRVPAAPLGQQLLDERQQPSSVAGPGARLRIVAGLELEAVGGPVADVAQRHRGRPRSRVEREHPHRRQISSVRRSPPACASRTPAAMRPNPAISVSAPLGHSTNAIVCPPK